MAEIIRTDEREARQEGKPVAQYLRELSEVTRELSADWLFQMASPEVKRQMLAERGLRIAEAA